MGKLPQDPYIHLETHLEQGLNLKGAAKMLLVILLVRS